MTVEITLAQSDLDSAEQFLTAFLSEKIPDASFEEGSAIRDFAVKSFSYIFAFLRGEIDRVAARQSLLKIQQLTDSDDIRQASDELLSNWFISRQGGGYAHTIARLHFSEKSTIRLPLTTKLWRDSSHLFYINSSGDSYVIPEDDLLPSFNSRGELIDYVVDVPLKASRIGSDFQFPKGTFVRVDSPGGLSYFSYAEHLEDITTGNDIESTAGFITRAQTAVTTRNLINARSCDALLKNEFASIANTLTLGAGDPEMVRDIYEFYPDMRVHSGGKFDTYVETPLVQIEEQGTVGGYFVRPDHIINIFRDPGLTHSTSSPVLFSAVAHVGDVLYVHSGISQAPMAFPITRVTDHQLEVSLETPFAEASDETNGTVVYSVGKVSPDWADEISERTATASPDPDYSDIPFGTSRRLCESGKIVLSGLPIQDIVLVEIMEPTPSQTVITYPTTGTIRATIQVNANPIGPMGEPSLVQFQQETWNPAEAQSLRAVNVINVGYLTDPTAFDGQNLRVVYQTLSDFADIDSFVMDRNTRIVAANQLVKAFTPTYISMVVPYRMKLTATGETLDQDAAAQFIATFLNGFDPNDDLDVSDIATQLRTEYPFVGAVYPFSLYYTLHSPDGQLIEFSTTDIVSIFPSSTNGVVLENSGDLVVPDVLKSKITSISTAADLLVYFNYLGLSNRTLKLRSDSSRISFINRG